MPESKQRNKTSERQLAAIMFTDIVGYTALMGKDSAKALELVRISKEIQKPLVEKHDGKWLKEIGDGILAKFNTALDAVNCAIEIQKNARATFDGKLRIGIHSGDITIENDDVFGDGVNIASRLESIADPGGIYISESIEKAIRGQTNVKTKYLGEISLKNVDYEVKTYAVQGIGLPVPEIHEKTNLSERYWAEMQRRGVIRAGITYIIISLILLLLYPYFKLPEWGFNVLITLLVIGFPLSIALAWYFERSPEGFVRTNSKQSWQNPYKPSQRKPLTSNFIVVCLILVIIFMYTYPRYLLPNEPEKEIKTEISSGERSIAVIPFVDLSPQGDQEWFSDGMMEEILNHLAQIQDLMVTSRTSAIRYKGSDKSLQQIGKELGVSHILEGSVRKQNNRVRITVQLIDVETDHHLWSDTYDRTLNDVFAIQSEVAQQVASSLQVQVHPEVKLRIEAQPTSNSHAYDLYLEGLFLYYKLNYEDWANARKLFEKVIEIDPGFAEAYVYLGQLKSSFTWADDGSIVSTPEEAVYTALPYYEKALEIDSDNIVAHEHLGYLYLWYQWDFKKAEKEYKIVKRLDPQYTWPDFLISSGQFDKAVEETEKSIQIDPFNETVWGGRLMSLYFGGDRKKTIEAIEMVLRNKIDHNPVERGRVYLYLGLYEETTKLLDSLRNNFEFGNVPRVTGTLAIAYFHLGENEKSDQLLNDIIGLSKKSSVGSPSFYVAMIYAQMNKIDLAFDWLEKAYQNREVEMYWLKVEPPFEPLHKDPRWQEMLEKVGFP